MAEGPTKDWTPNEQLEDLPERGHCVLAEENGFLDKTLTEVCICIILCFAHQQSIR